jgi:hypothetical protein
MSARLCEENYKTPSVEFGKPHFSNRANRDVMSSIYEHFMSSLRKES